MKLSTYAKNGRFLAPMLAVLAAGCGVSSNIESLNRNSNRMADQMEQDQAYLKAVTEQLKRMSDSLEHFKKLADDVSKVMNPEPSPSPSPAASGIPAATGSLPGTVQLPGPDDIFGPDPAAASPSPSPSPSPSTSQPVIASLEKTS